MAVVASFAIAGYGVLKIFEAPSALGTVVWFGGAIVAHDLIAFPLYTALAALAGRSLGGRRGVREAERRVPAINHLRIPAYLSALAFLLFFPLILGLSEERFQGSTGFGTDVYLGRWMALCGALFLGSAVIYALRLRLAARRAATARPATTAGGE